MNIPVLASPSDRILKSNLGSLAPSCVNMWAGALPPSDPAWAVALGVIQNLVSLKDSPAVHGLLASVAYSCTEAAVQGQALSSLTDNVLAAAANNLLTASAEVAHASAKDNIADVQELSSAQELALRTVLAVGLELAVHASTDVR